MAALRILFRAHRRLAGLLLALALLAKIIIPGGFMPVVTSDGLVLELCSGMERTQAPMAMAMPGMAGDHHDQKGDKADSPCSFAGLTAPFIAGADPALLAIAVLFILALGRVAERRVVLPYRHALRPPLRGPPVAA
ncbi:hypothetical protein E2E30_07665 [Sphingomonas sp. AAP5]|uniref:DUF2946 family protein n=1 Tax=Sphingomonas sp. AAP5 TaxID=1523415 RepID=UPI0010575F15|nr:DUF2946 family protein [Sphingomonas sp. AAP5]QBM75665.1 hypothetical protein E2E30_07665 [Sphingomonas sp. AAP5]